MLIVAIPKSASTSLIHTLGKIHQFNTTQDFSFKTNEIPLSAHYLFKLHSDVRELTNSEVEKFSKPNFIYKQHIYPSENNLSKITNLKKVILLREPNEIILAYRRGVIKKTHTLFEGFSLNMTEKQWIEKSIELGLMSDIQNFYTKWNELDGQENVLIIYYQDLIDSPKEVINKIENFWNLPVTEEAISLSKKRYTRRSTLSSYVHFSLNKINFFYRKIIKIFRKHL